MPISSSRHRINCCSWKNAPVSNLYWRVRNETTSGNERQPFSEEGLELGILNGSSSDSMSQTMVIPLASHEATRLPSGAKAIPTGNSNLAPEATFLVTKSTGSSCPKLVEEINVNARIRCREKRTLALVDLSDDVIQVP